MPKYQIRFCDKQGNGSFNYFDAEENIEQKAADTVNDYLKNRLTRGFDSFIPPKKLDVWEMDMTTKEPKVKGHRFKLQLFKSTVHISGRNKVVNEWYEPIEVTPKEK